MKSHPDILIVGGGVIGLTTALNLALQRVSVTVVDRQSIGCEASWAGAGMLPPGKSANACTAEARLRAYSHDLWGELSEQLRHRTGIDNGFRRCGAIEVAGGDLSDFQRQVDEWIAEGIDVEKLDRHQLERHIPDLHSHIDSGIYLREFGQVRNPRHIKALAAACQNLGVDILENCEQLQLTDAGQGRVVATTGDRTLPANRICVCAGAWTAQLLKPLDVHIPVKPIRGQMAQLRVSPMLFSRVIEQGRRYIVPRNDGLVLVGSTMEDAGFQKKTTADGISGLLTFAESMVPELGKAEVVRCWSGLRPGSPDELPFIGPAPEYTNLFVGAGHFRSGLQMSPATGAVLADLLLDNTPSIDLTGLAVDRPVQCGWAF